MCRTRVFMRSWTISVQTAFVEDLTRLSGVPGSIDIVALASTAESEEQARFLASCLDMLANYHQSHSPLVSIIARGTIVGRDRAGMIVVPVEVDYVSWTKRTSYFANRARSRIAETKRLALRPNVAAREKEFSSVGMERARENKALTARRAAVQRVNRP